MPTTERNGSAVQQAVDLVRDRIRQGEWGPGHRLVESELTTQLGVSRGPLREALGRLEAEGLVTIEPFRGAMVRRMSREDVESLYQVRELLEGLSARLAADRVASDASARRRLVSEIKALERVGERGERREIMDENSRFHQLLIELGANPVAAETLARLNNQIYRYTMRNMFDQKSVARSCRQHLAVAKAVLDGDGTKAERLMRNHVRVSGQEVIKLIEALS